MDIIITLPSHVDWSEYMKELDAVKDWKSTMNFKVPFIPKNIKKGDRCYLVHQGYIIGWMSIIGTSSNDSFDCTTTGKKWSGCFIQRSGPFHYIDKQIPMKGFQGVHYFNHEEYGI